VRGDPALGPMKLRFRLDGWRFGGTLLLLIGVIGLGVSLYRWAELRRADQEIVVYEERSPESGFVPLTLMNVQEGAPTLAIATPEVGESTPAMTVPGANQSAPTFEPTPTPLPAIPKRLIIAKIDLDAPITPVKARKVKVGEAIFGQWLAPDEFAVGWPTETAMLGQVGNTVLIGHHNVHGKVFERLHELEAGDLIVVEGGSRRFSYQVVNVMILPERDADLQTRLENARWIQPSQDERLTLVTCWPANSNTHRLIIVARPIGQSPLPDAEPQ
jgi:LPXTG-site transpeptidase (sortase) family protein